jgi:hypothetical protein
LNPKSEIRPTGVVSACQAVLLGVGEPRRNGYRGSQNGSHSNNSHFARHKSFLFALKVVPLEFALSLDGFRTVRTCRPIWRQAAFPGWLLIADRAGVALPEIFCGLRATKILFLIRNLASPFTSGDMWP